jgi:glyoxylate/hydroxypyruvate reductase A
MLDVFDTEPLPADDPLWAHPSVIITPHVASFGARRERARHVAVAIAAFERGETPPGLYDPARGY